MKRLSQYFLRGLMAVLPLALTVYLLYIFFAWTEGLTRVLVEPVFGHLYIPGLGLLTGVVLIMVLGFLLSQRRMRSFLSLFELPFTNLPLVKSIYTSLKSFADYFSPQTKETSQQVVVVTFPSDMEIIGLVTRSHLDDLPEGVSKDDRLAVYLPMGYMIGGYTLFVKRSWTRPIEMTVEEAMRASLIAWMSTTARKP